MNAAAGATAFSLDKFLAEQTRKDLLRFITCGSVDDGKSTLIGRLLYETKLLFEDQIAELEAASRRNGTQGEEIDFALLLDGLAAEREQGITIDVAYRFFATNKRKFIVADTPGHEQYTRNMATGASTADLAVILIDARKGLIAQTRRHSLIVSMLGVCQAVVVINKMDLVDWSEAAFRAIEREYRAFAANLGFDEIVVVPVSAKNGDNVVARSAQADWYNGPTLLERLETVEIGAATQNRPFRMAVQWVNRPNADFRGFAGTISSGEAHVGMAVAIAPSGKGSRIASIATYDGDLVRAGEGRSVTLTLTDEVDVSRGDMIVAADRPPHVSDRLTARVLWMADEPLVAGRDYLVKLGARSEIARVVALHHEVDLQTMRNRPSSRLQANAIGSVALLFERPVAFDLYAEQRETGSFILIDRDSYDTVGMGLVQGGRAAGGDDPALSAVAKSASARVESRRRSLAKALSWRFAGSALSVSIAFLITGSVEIAALIGLAEIAVKTAAYYGHERLWALAARTSAHSSR